MYLKELTGPTVMQLSGLLFSAQAPALAKPRRIRMKCSLSKTVSGGMKVLPWPSTERLGLFLHQTVPLGLFYTVGV